MNLPWWQCLPARCRRMHRSSWSWPAWPTPAMRAPSSGRPEAAGADGIVLAPAGSVDPYNRKCVRVWLAGGALSSAGDRRRRPRRARSAIDRNVVARADVVPRRRPPPPAGARVRQRGARILDGIDAMLSSAFLTAGERESLNVATAATPPALRGRPPLAMEVVSARRAVYRAQPCSHEIAAARRDALAVCV